MRVRRIFSTFGSSKIGDEIDAGEGGDDLHPLRFGEDGPAAALELPDRPVAVQGDDEDVAFAFRRLEVPDVSGVDEVEAAVGQDDAPAFFPFGRDDAAELGEGLELLQCSETIACLSSSGLTVAVPFFMTTIPPA